MLNHPYRRLLGFVSYAGICGATCALAFLGEFAFPAPLDVPAAWPQMHALTADFVPQPGDFRKKE
jgi:hypothetical protein